MWGVEWVGKIAARPDALRDPHIAETPPAGHVASTGPSPSTGVVGGAVRDAGAMPSK